jgi:hypothetical protein
MTENRQDFMCEDWIRVNPVRKLEDVLAFKISRRQASSKAGS